MLSLFLSSCGENTSQTPANANGIRVIESTAAPASATATPAANAEPMRYTEYNVSLEIAPDTRIINGVEKVSFKNNTGAPIDKIYFNMYLNAFSNSCSYEPYFEDFEKKIYENGYDYGYIKISDASVNAAAMQYTIDDTVLTIQLSEKLEAGGNIDIGLIFEAYIPAINHRTGANGHALWCGNFLPTLAVYDENGWHKEPYYPAGDPFYTNIANYNVKITTPSGYIISATGEETANDIDGKKVTTVSAKMVRDFAFAVMNENCKIKTVKTNSGVYINMYYYSELDDIDEFLETARHSIDYFSVKIGSYPYPSFDIVETGFFLTGAMEYPGITFIDSDYLKTPQSLHSLSHEIGHQWFYNIIGNNQVKEPWLDEGLTSYLQLGIYMDNKQVRESIEKDYAKLVQKLPGIENGSLLQDLSVYKTWSDYYNIQYLRSKLMFYSLHQKMGDELFNKFLKTYYSKFSFAIADKKGLIGTAEEVYGSSLTDFFNAWMEDLELPSIN